MCLILLEWTCYHYEFSLLKSTQSVISRLAAPWNFVPTALLFVHPCEWNDGQPFTGGVDQWLFEPYSTLTFFTQKMYFRSFLSFLAAVAIHQFIWMV